MPDVQIDVNDPEILALVGAIQAGPSVGATVAEAKMSPVNDATNFDRDTVAENTAQSNTDYNISPPTMGA